MRDLWSRGTRRPSVGRSTVVRGRARLLVGSALAVTLGVGVLTMFDAPAFANAPAPVKMDPAVIVQNANGTVSVTVTGTWVWVYSGVLDTPGIKATDREPCDRRAGAGYGWAWFDPNDPGYSETWTGHGLFATLGMGSTGVIPANSQAYVSHDPAHRCGNFVLTNSPAQGDGYDTDTVSATHIYASMDALPPVVCMVTWDLGMNVSRISKERFTNHDNSVRWSLIEHNTWAESPNGPNCTKVGNGPVPDVTPATTPKKVTVSKSTPKPTPTTAPAPAPKPVTKPSGTLAFTGFGTLGRLTTVLGAALVLIGLMVYFLDLRPATVWLLGRSPRSWGGSDSRGTWIEDRRAGPAPPPVRRDRPGVPPKARGPGTSALSSTRWGSRGRSRGR